MANPVLPCPWPTTDWCGRCAEFSATNPALFQQKLDAAIVTVFRATYSRYTGICEVKIRPCKRGGTCCTPFPDTYFSVGSRGNTIYNNWCAVDCFDNCDCGSSDCLELPYGPIDSIAEVKVDGVVLPPSAYFIKDRKFLCRRDGLLWDTCQDLALDDDQPGTFSIRYNYGLNPPLDLVDATYSYACEVAKQCLNLPCELPRAITERDGQLILDPLIYVSKGLTGYAPLDAIIMRLNKHGALRTAQFRNPRKYKKTHTVEG